jgi:CubicO group peptidase (beta-lactamase class C family)
MPHPEPSSVTLRTHRWPFGVVLVAAIFITTLCLANAQTKPQSSGPLAQVLQPLVDNHIVAGAVALVANKNKVIDVETVGYADLATHSPMHSNDEFWIASMTKPMTAAAVMMLVDEGKVKLDDPVEKYLPEFKGQMVRAVKPEKLNDPGEYHGALVPQSHPFTVREMLCHTAGLLFRSSVIEQHGVFDQHPLVEAVRAYASEPLIYQPSTDYSYSNEDFNIAGRIIEVVSGMPYEKFMQQRLFNPLGMTDTTFWPSREQISRLAKSYKTKADGTGMVEVPIVQLTLPLDDHLHRYPLPAGGLFSTAHDATCFMQMLFNNGTFQGNKILSEAEVHEMTKVQNNGLEHAPYGFGLHIWRNKFGHNGAYKTSMLAFPDSGAILVVMVQIGSGFNDKVLSPLDAVAEKLATDAAR